MLERLIYTHVRIGEIHTYTNTRFRNLGKGKTLGGQCVLNPVSVIEYLTPRGTVHTKVFLYERESLSYHLTKAGKQPM